MSEGNQMEDRIKNNSNHKEEIEQETAEQVAAEENLEEAPEASAAENQQSGNYDHREQIQQDEYYGDPSQYGYDPRYAQQGYAQQYGYYNNGQYNDPYYQQNADPRYAQNMDPRYAQQYGDPYYQQNMDPRYAQQNMDPRYAQQYQDQYYQQNMDPRYAQQYYGQSGQGYPGYAQYGPQGEDPYYATVGGRRRQDRVSGRNDESRGRSEEAEYDQPYDEDDYGRDDYEEDYEEEEYEERPRKKKRSGFSKAMRSFKRKLSRIPTRTLLLIGGGIVLLLIAIILLVVLLPKNPGSQEVVVATSPTPVATETPEPTPDPTEAPTATPHPLATPLEFGMTGDIVAEIQQRLIDLGYMEYPVVDGVQQVTTVYGKTTKNAIRTFQSKNGLDTDGNCGPLTYDALMSDDAKAFYIERNDEGDAVKKLQEALISLGYLKASATGSCGPSTVDAIKAFQTANQLEADGKAGQTTLQLLYSGNAVRAGAATSATAAPSSTDAPTDTPKP